MKLQSLKSNRLNHLLVVECWHPVREVPGSVNNRVIPKTLYNGASSSRVSTQHLKSNTGTLSRFKTGQTSNVHNLDGDSLKSEVDRCGGDEKYTNDNAEPTKSNPKKENG